MVTSALVFSLRGGRHLLVRQPGLPCPRQSLRAPRRGRTDTAWCQHQTWLPEAKWHLR